MTAASPTAIRFSVRIRPARTARFAKWQLATASHAPARLIGVCELAAGLTLSAETAGATKRPFAGGQTAVLTAKDDGGV